ncbi:conserved hypothetical protein [Pyrobaculum islandicum DSM 4184]|uniref:Uncharacterized protein n=1 Tax=Pyrobaculum islandicum (strain DSM 4184 / JCM 9189 / GEO3) TaxID=384616 RepID=A1RU51_PYRIL|nr:fucose isomerase [Pyrobaculum islandicum]ABL88483.1 conserved hypothetical protein [Pyrobaculum islandicum DSM 4184]
MAYFLASAVHGVDYVAEVERYVARYVSLKNPERPEGERFPVIIHGTGGTTAQALELVEKAGARGAVLVGFGEYNSFASALHTKAELEASGRTAVVYHCPSYAECGPVLAKAVRVSAAASSLIGVKAVLIGSKTRQADIVRERFGWHVEVVSLADFESAAANSEPDGEALSLFKDERVAKVAAALRKLASGADLIAIQCFPFLIKARYTPCPALALLNAKGSTVACEGDLSAGFAMLLLRRLAGESSWIANVVESRGERATFAHCTVSLDLVERWWTMPHFESGLPYGIAGELRRGVYTTVSISPGFEKAVVGRVYVERSGNYLQSACRTQATVRFGRPVRLEAEAPANHHVFAPGDVAAEAVDVLKLLSISTVIY